MAEVVPRSPDSTIAASEAGERTPHATSTAHADPRNSLRHVLVDQTEAPINPPKFVPNEDNTGATSSLIAGKSSELSRSQSANEVPSMDTSPPPPPPPPPPTGSSRKRKEPAPAVSSNGQTTSATTSKLQHLKKNDGEPLWRKDIQYDFLKAIFENPLAVFTNSYEPDKLGKQTFADLYIDTMARSSKTSKILRDKLLHEHEPARNMAMVCLLVNMGRMNTTLNFFPEMRAQLRTYHAIPSLQAQQDPNAYKQLQDAPRLKSILKGASEDRPEPNSLDNIKKEAIPRTNPVNMIFVLCQFSTKVTELHIPPGIDFFDLLMKYDLSSESRARAFLWLMWFYLESDFTEEGAEENPFGPGVDYDVDVRNQGLPQFTYLSQQEEDAENVDTPDEIDFGKSKQQERRKIIEADLMVLQAESGTTKRAPKPKAGLGDEAVPSPSNHPKAKETGFCHSFINRGKSKYDSDIDSSRSTPPPRALASANIRFQASLGTTSKNRSLRGQAHEGSSPVPQDVPVMRRPRPLTAHQLAVERKRNERVDRILSRGIRKKRAAFSQTRKEEGAIFRAMRRIEKMTDPFMDSDDEGDWQEDPPFREKGPGGLIPLKTEDEDFGEEMAAYASALRRTARRLDRWDKIDGAAVIAIDHVATKYKGINGQLTKQKQEDDDRQRKTTVRRRPYTNGDVHMSNNEDLDDMEKEILGLGSEAEEDEDLDDVEKTLLGIRGDETEDESEDGAYDKMEL